MKAEGKIRNLGFSCHGTPEELQRMVNVRDWDFAQIQLNYLDWSYQRAEEQYKVLENAGLPIIVMEPIRGGRLANLGEMGKAMEDYAPDKSQASWALRWVASHPAIQVVLSGMSDYAQVQDNLATFADFKPMNEEENAILADTAKALVNSALIPCTGCRYCSECPQSLDIPRLLKMYEDYLLSRSVFSILNIRHMPENERPSSCIGCGHCESRCPQHIEIPRLLAELSDSVANIGRN